jgi:Ser/Thr protein kinase RdoA (MazF antagonist)
MLSSDHLGVFVKDRYSLAGEVQCSILRGGLNDTYLISAESHQYVFRVYSLNWRTREQILEELTLLELLAEHKIPVSFAIRDLDDEYIQTIPAPEGERFGVLFSFASGEKLQNYSAEIHYKVGEVMARFHSITTNRTLARTTYSSEVLLDKPLEYLSTFLPKQTEEWEYIDTFRKYLLSEFNPERMSKLRQGIIHLDIWFDNLNIDSDGSVTLFDFDFCGNGWLALDIGYYVMQLNHVEREEAVYQEKLNSFLAGYESITKIPEEEKELFILFGLALNIFYVGTQCQRFENWSNSFVSEQYLKRYIMGVIKRNADIRGVNVL